MTRVSDNLLGENEFGGTTRLLDWGCHIPNVVIILQGAPDNLDRDLLIGRLPGSPVVDDETAKGEREELQEKKG